MHLENFDLNLLVALDALLTEKHVTRAAEKLRVSQPTMSAALARLRIYFSDPLLTKVGNSLELTQRASEIAHDVRDLLFRARRTLRQETTFDPMLSTREVCIDMPDFAMMVFLPKLRDLLAREAPNMRITVQYLDAMSLERASRGQVDFCIAAVSAALGGDRNTYQLRESSLFGDVLDLAMNRQAVPGCDALSVDQLGELPHLATRFTASVVDSIANQQKRPLRVIMTLPSFSAAAFLLAASPATALIPRRLLHLLGAQPGLVVRDAPWRLPPILERLVWHERIEEDAALRWFLEAMLQVARTMADEHIPRAA